MSANLRRISDRRYERAVIRLLGLNSPDAVTEAAIWDELIARAPIQDPSAYRVRSMRRFGIVERPFE